MTTPRSDPAPETPRTTDDGERDGNFASWARSNDTTANDLDLINPAIRSAWNAAWKFCAPRTMAAQPAASDAPSTRIEAEPVGEVVVTTTEDGRCVAVTRQDEDGKILSVIWGAAPARTPDARSTSDAAVVLPDLSFDDTKEST